MAQLLLSELAQAQYSDFMYRGGIGYGAHMAEVSMVPSNDECSNAIPLPAAGYLCQPVTASNANATQSIAPAPCDGLSIAVKDMWYTFTATETAHRVKVDGLGTFTAAVDVRTSCTGPYLDCDIANSPSAIAQVDLTGLVIGSLYYVRVYGLGSPGNSNFKICVQKPDCSGVYDGPALEGNPCNDGNPNTVGDQWNANCQCAGNVLPNEPATAGSLKARYACVLVSGTTVGATQTFPPITCNGVTSTSANDVWYGFSPSAAYSTSARVRVSGNGSFNPVVQVYNAFGTSIGCADLTGAGGTEEVLLTGLGTGTHLVRVYGRGGVAGTFTICIQRPDCSNVYDGENVPDTACDDGDPNTVDDHRNNQCQCIGRPVNDECSGAIGLAAHHACELVHGSNLNASQSLDPLTCAARTSTSARDVWYSFEATSTKHRITGIGNGAFDPIVDVRTSCSAPSIACADATTTGGTEVVELVGLEIGQSYYVRVYCWAGCQGTFSICLETPDCEGVYGGPVVPFTPCDDGSPMTMYDEINESCQCTGTPAEVSVSPSVLLEGAYDSTTGLMYDDLRAQGLVPRSEPYSELGRMIAGYWEADPVAFTTIGPNAIVDWVIIELRRPATPSIVLVSSPALLQRDGNVVAMDGNTPVKFQWIQPGSYYVVVRHRNHLGVMTAAPVSLGILAATVDFRLASTPTWGTEARKSVTGTYPAQVLWTGDVNFNGQVKYVGTNNDRDQILQAVGGATPTNVVNGYTQQDVNLDGQVKYTGAGNDRDPILQTIGGSVHTNVRYEQVP